jgi:gamma-glutamylcyclotransferase (GGCT)/AIG2-like uncharacterized protein YtfP
MLCFAYGSNMDWGQMRRRCPTARFVAVAKLEAHRLCFPRRSKSRDCGVSSVVPSKPNHVWGVVFQIDELDIGALDKFEGFDPNQAPDANSYNRKEIRVLRNGIPGAPLTVFTYIAVAQRDPPLPNHEYRDTIVRGAEYWHLPPEYVAKLKCIKVGK